jgi:hypothetical protein
MFNSENSGLGVKDEIHWAKKPWAMFLAIINKRCHQFCTVMFMKTSMKNGHLPSRTHIQNVPLVLVRIKRCELLLLNVVDI